MTVIARPANGRGNPLLNNDEQYADVDELIRKLVSHIVRSRDSATPAGPEFCREEVILDIDIDGVRYLMIRVPLHNSVGVSLSPREQEISRMVARGYPNKTIAGVLNISCWTVCAHIRRIFAKLGVASRAAMVARLLEEGGGWEQRPGARSTTPLNLRRTATPHCSPTSPGKNATKRNLARDYNR
jgi:DNA-binding CsgD family transcriptional regulator